MWAKKNVLIGNEGIEIKKEQRIFEMCLYEYFLYRTHNEVHSPPQIFNLLYKFKQQKIS
jgi:hypothetical protein